MKLVGRALARNPTVKTRVEMGAVKYHYNVLGLGGPRRMTAILPAPQDDGKPYVFLPSSISHNGPAILDHYKNGRQRDKMIVLHSKQPHFNKKVRYFTSAPPQRTFRFDMKSSLAHRCHEDGRNHLLTSKCANTRITGLDVVQLAAYCLNFHGRVTRPSVKNFQVLLRRQSKTWTRETNCQCCKLAYYLSYK